jgi:hypothetical protein
MVQLAATADDVNADINRQTAAQMVKHSTVARTELAPAFHPSARVWIGKDPVALIARMADTEPVKIGPFLAYNGTGVAQAHT